MTLTRKKKICKGHNELDWIYAHGLCAKCYAAQNPRKPPKRGITIKNDDYGFTSQIEMFKYIWENTENKRCLISDAPLKDFEGTNKWANCFAHVIPKGLYPKYKLNPQNIVLLHPDIHYLYDFGTEKQRLDSGHNFNKLYKLKEQLKQEYNGTNT